ncbi:hypothetical protein TNCV_2958761 [Trichonephila clavipes]|nr:hypothetical protein TNCV_2958761 [Trichonephila clavipes]
MRTLESKMVLETAWAQPVSRTTSEPVSISLNFRTTATGGYLSFARISEHRRPFTMGLQRNSCFNKSCTLNIMNVKNEVTCLVEELQGSVWMKRPEDQHKDEAKNGSSVTIGGQ